MDRAIPPCAYKLHPCAMITVWPNTSGYQSRSSFTRTFGRYYGSDPSEYRSKAQRAPSSSAAPAEDAIVESDAA